MRCKKIHSLTLTYYFIFLNLRLFI